MLNEPTPAELDPNGEWYTFDRGVAKTGSGNGWADVWKRGYFGWEYKSKHKDLNAAYAQLQRYAVALENPPLLVVSDMETFVVHTNFTNTVHEQHVIGLLDLEKEKPRHLLKTAFSNPDQLMPGKTRERLTEEAASEFTKLALKLRESKGYAPQTVAHFVNKILFCLFAEDIGLLPNRLFKKLLEAALKTPSRFQHMAANLFTAMSSGGDFGPEIIDWFNGGLFDDALTLPLDQEDIRSLLGLSGKDWSSIEPSIFGTLFERGLDPDKRSQLGAHYTDRKSIERIVYPVVLDPLAQEWEENRDKLKTLQEKGWRQDVVSKTANSLKERTTAKRVATEAFKEADAIYRGFLAKLAGVRVLDPACGSGNFLYVALQGLHDLEHQVMIEAESLGLHMQFPQVGPEAAMGIELNTYAAELSRVTLWIGEIQWMLDHGYSLGRNPVLRKLDHVACRDALLNPDGSEAQWPDADFIVGNPPFLGNKRMIAELEEEYVSTLRKLFKVTMSPGSDLVAFWFDKARREIESGRCLRAGLVATNSIRGGQNREVLSSIERCTQIFDAWSDEPWILDGANVRVSIVCFGKTRATEPMLNGKRVARICCDLTEGYSGSAIDFTAAATLPENLDVMFMGTTMVGAFEVPGALARQWLRMPLNVNGRPNSDVVRPRMNALSMMRGASDNWVIDFGPEMLESEAALYEAPYEYIKTHVLPERKTNRRKSYAEYWWRFGETRPRLRALSRSLRRFIATPAHSKHRVFAFVPSAVVVDHAVFVIVRDDYTTFGILHSRCHELWALRMGTTLEDRPRYTPTSTFETFPFPAGLEPNVPAAHYASDVRATAIAKTAENLNSLREAWLVPPDLVIRTPEIVPGLPDRITAVSDAAACELKTRTLTNLYNAKPSWLSNAHKRLDDAVAVAYGWAEDISDDEVLNRLLALNMERSSRLSLYASSSAIDQT